MNKIYKSILGVSAAAVTLAATLTPVVVNAWGNTGAARPSYTIADIDAGKLGDKITFNSISNSKIGDEKNFVGAKVGASVVGGAAVVGGGGACVVCGSVGAGVV